MVRVSVFHRCVPCLVRVVEVVIVSLSCSERIFFENSSLPLLLYAKNNTSIDIAFQERMYACQNEQRTMILTVGPGFPGGPTAPEGPGGPLNENQA